jgi:hypothetical protein
MVVVIARKAVETILAVAVTATVTYMMLLSAV